MKTIFKFRTIVLLTVAFALFSCSDWKETESIEITAPNFGQDNPELYAKYLAALRDYKASNHQIVFSWFDNSNKTPMSYGQRLSGVPDSVDVVALIHPDNLTEQEKGEIKTLQQDKGTKVIGTFNYNAILAQFEAMTVAGEGEEVVPAPEEEFIAMLTKETKNALSLVDKYGYDGISIFYEPRLLEYLDAEQKAIETARQETFVGLLKEWRTKNPKAMFVMEGRPYNMIDLSPLNSCDYIVMRAFDATSHYELSRAIIMALRDGVPTDRFIIGVQAKSLDPNTPTIGLFADASGALKLSAITETATWVASPENGYTKAGMGIYNIQNDYYNRTLTYKNTRTAIFTINPSAKK